MLVCFCTFSFRFCLTGSLSDGPTGWTEWLAGILLGESMVDCSITSVLSESVGLSANYFPCLLCENNGDLIRLLWFAWLLAGFRRLVAWLGGHKRYISGIGTCWKRLLWADPCNATGSSRKFQVVCRRAGWYPNTDQPFAVSTYLSTCLSARLSTHEPSYLALHMSICQGIVQSNHSTQPIFHRFIIYPCHYLRPIYQPSHLSIGLSVQPIYLSRYLCIYRNLSSRHLPIWSNASFFPSQCPSSYLSIDWYICLSPTNQKLFISWFTYRIRLPSCPSICLNFLSFFDLFVYWSDPACLSVFRFICLSIYTFLCWSICYLL